MTFLVLCLTLGLLLAQRFRVLVLVPATLLAMLAGGMAGGDGLGAKALMCALIAASLQIGYLFGLGLRFFSVPALDRRPRTVPRSGSRTRRPAH